MSDKETIDVYDAQAAEYAKLVTGEKREPALESFMERLPNGARVLDWGCGPGNSAAKLRDAGFETVATDASAEMVKLAKQTYDLDVRLESFDQLTSENDYDGIWANFSLLHASRAEFPTYLAAAHKALKPGGAFHIGMKLGEGEARDSIGRFYVYYSLDGLKSLLSDAGFTVISERTGETKGLAGQVDPFAILLTHA